MKNKFTIGVITGMAALVAAVPAIAQISSAATPATTDATATTATNDQARAPKAWVVPGSTVASVQEMITRDQDFLANVDASVSLQKTTTQAHLSALQAAASITDDAQREAAVKQAEDARRVAIDAAITANPNLKMGMMFGGHGGPGGPGGKHGGPDMAGLAAKLGMTETELKTAIDGGKTIQQIATEKGVTLPPRPAFGGRGHGPMGENDGTQLGAPGTASADHPGMVLDADGDEWVPAGTTDAQ